MRKFWAIPAASALLVLSACSDSTPVITGDDMSGNSDTEQTGGDGEGTGALLNIVDTAVAAGSFTTLAAALGATDLISVLADDSAEFTVFAPTDEAFAALGDDAINGLLADPDTLRDILLYHVVPGSVDAATAISLAGTTVTTANEDDFALTVDGGNLFVNMSQVTATDIQASNGIIHVIDAVLMPPVDTADEMITGSIVETAVAAGNFTTLVAALQATGLDAVLANLDDQFTVFAPTDEAFAALGQDTINALLADPDTLSDILLYHVLGGQVVDSVTAMSLAGQSVATSNGDEISISINSSGLRINESQVIAADVRASNGIIHAIDAVLIPPTDTDTGTGTDTDTDAGTILDGARGNPDFSILVTAIEATGLQGALGHPGDLYTVFAPTNAAFEALGTETIEALLADPDTLREILLYHVIAGTVVDAATAVTLVGNSIEAGSGDRFTLRLDGSNLFVNDSLIVATDIAASNGIIHVIDQVLIP